jgi:glycosyltransferase involved in cell wall biosynthesis
MKTLLYAQVDVALPGGLETHVRELALALAARGHEVAVCARASAPVPFPLIATPAFDAWDVVHHHAGAWPRALDRHPATVRTLHFCVAAKMDVYVRLGRLRTLANLANWRAVLDERTAARGDGPLIAVAERVRRDFARYHGLDPGRVTVISNGVPPPRASEGRAALRHRHGLGDGPVLLTIGRPDFVKGHDLLERAWRRSGAAARRG